MPSPFSTCSLTAAARAGHSAGQAEHGSFHVKFQHLQDAKFEFVASVVSSTIYIKAKIRDAEKKRLNESVLGGEVMRLSSSQEFSIKKTTNGSVVTGFTISHKELKQNFRLSEWGFVAPNSDGTIVWTVNVVK